MFYDPKEFEFIRAFEEKWEVIRDEFLGLDPRIIDLHRVGSHEQYILKLIKNNGWVPSWQVDDQETGKSNEANYGWLTYGLSYSGLFPEEAASRFPQTMALLRSLKGFKVCAFSKMRPRTMIAPHNHPELGGDLLTFHMGIQLKPARSYLCVEGEFREEREGGSLVFDGNAEHAAINMSNDDRVILYMEFSKSQIRFV